MRATPMHARRARLRAALVAGSLCTCAAPTTPRPAQPATPATPPELVAPATPPELVTPATPPSEPTTPPPPTEPAAPPAQPVTPRACTNGERLDTGCTCSGGACFDICCGPDAGCAHPSEPGGPSACILQPLPPPKPPPKLRACKDGEFMADGCQCKHTTCMDICCVGSSCSHHSSPDGGWAKCMSMPKRGK